MQTTTIHVTPAQAEVLQRLIVSSPWFRTKAKKCVFTSGNNNTLEFELDTDSADLLKMVRAAPKFGYRYQTCQALANRIATATSHAMAVARSRKAS